MSALILKHLDALAATMQLGLAQIEAARHALTPVPPTVDVKVLERCRGIAAEDCALQDGKWQSLSSFANPSHARCNGCGAETP